MSLQLTSDAFTNGQSIPAKYSCKGRNISPALAWNEPPAGTQSFTLIVDDPDAPMGTWVHWVLFNIPADKLDRLMDVDLPALPLVPYDFVVYLPYEDLPPRGVTLGVTLEPTPPGRGLAVKAVAPGSNAEQAGVRSGDRLTAIDGEPLSDAFDLLYALKQKEPGARGRLQIERQGQTLNVDVLFRQTGEVHPPMKR